MRRRLLLISITFLSGAGMLCLEMSAVRVLAPYFGTSIYVWTNIIATILAALAAGYWLGGRLAETGADAGTIAVILAGAGIASLAAPQLVRPVTGIIVSPALPEGALRAVVLRGSLFSTLVLFGPAMVLLGAVSPMLVRLLAVDMGVGRASGAVSGTGTLGALVGTYATTLWLIPGLGTRRTVALAGLVLCACAASLMVYRGRPGLAAGLLAAAAPLSLALASHASAAPRSDPSVLAVRDTPYQYAVVRQEGRVRMLFQNETRTVAQTVQIQGSPITGGYYDQTLSLPALAGWHEGAPLRVAILGLAGGTISGSYHSFFLDRSALSIEGVEIDPGVLDLGRDFFGLTPDRHPRLHVVEADARIFLARSKGPFDVVIIDCFSGGIYIPFHLVTTEFFRLVRDRLAPGGVLGINVISRVPRSPLVAAMSGAVQEAFGAVYRIRVPETRNFLMVARAGGSAPDVANARRWLAALEAPDASPPGVSREDLSSVIPRLDEGLDRLILVPREVLDAPLTDDWAPVERLTDMVSNALSAGVLRTAPMPSVEADPRLVPPPSHERSIDSAPSALADPIGRLAILRADATANPGLAELTALRSLLEDLERYEEALGICERQLSLSPKDPTLHLARIELLGLLYRYREAADAAVAALGSFAGDRRFVSAHAANSARAREFEIAAEDARRAGVLSVLALLSAVAAIAGVDLAARRRIEQRPPAAARS